MTRQLWALLRLQWQLSRNSMTRRKLVNLIAASLVAMFFLFLAVGGTIGLFLLGQYLATLAPLYRLLVLNGVLLVFLLFTASGVLWEAQRNDWLDIRKLSLLPVSLRLLFSVNVFLSLFSALPMLFLVGALGLLAGRAVVDGTGVAWALLVSLTFVLQCGAWIYWWRGTLALWMQHPKRRRLLLTIIPMLTVAISQVPFLVSQGIGRLHGEDWRAVPAWLEQQLGHMGFQGVDLASAAYVSQAEAYLPPLWWSLGVWHALEGRTGPAILISLFHLASTAFALSIAYRGTIRHYWMGDTGGRRRRSDSGRPVRLSWRLPGLAADTSALVHITVRTLFRHPQMRMLMVMPAMMAIMLVAAFSVSAAARGTAVGFLPVFMLFWPFFNYTVVLCNQFGMDSAGFRGLMLMPTPRYRILLAKNLALAPFVLGLGWFMILLAAVVLRLPAETLLFAAIQQVALLLLVSGFGNLMSIQLPYPIRQDALTRPTGRGQNALNGLLAMGVMMLLMLPTAGCALLAASRGPVAGLAASLALLVAAAAAYAALLKAGGDMLQEHEQDVLNQLLRNTA